MWKKLTSPLVILTVIIVIASFFRLWKLTVNPVSLFGDELDLGYQAYSILKTGKDYYGNFMPLHFHSLAEWRTPLYLYSAVPTVAMFGVTPLGVRLPAAFFGILSVYLLYLLIKTATNNQKLGLISAFVMAINPWHLQYSRAGFEVTQLLFFLLLGLYLFFKSLKDGKYLWLSIVSFCLTPWVYSTAKLFTPFLLLFLAIVWFKEIFLISKKYLVWAFVSLIIFGGPIAYSTVFGGGSQRFGYISVFTNPVTEPEVGTARLTDAKARGETGTGLAPTFIDRLIHNKFTFWGENIIGNYLQSFSTDFLFVKGDINLRHSIGTGEFYKFEALLLIIGIIFFFSGKESWKTKLLVAFWILMGVFPSSITRDGGKHATRLILILPPLIFLISYGIFSLVEKYDKYSKYLLIGLLSLYLITFSLYLHRYYSHYPFESERWWHYGFGQAFSEIKKIDKDYDKVVISTSNEPPWVFFAGWYEYDPSSWQKEFPIGNDLEVKGFGKISHTGKFYFGSAGDIYSLGNDIEDKTIYLANAKEIGANLIMEPDRVPANLKLIKAIAFPSGEPAYYILTKSK